MRLPPKVLPYSAIHASPNEMWLQRCFHRWLQEQQLSLSMLCPKHTRRFMATLLNRPLTPTTRSIYRRKFLHYLDWLHLKGFIRFNPDCFRPKSRPKHVHLPDAALRYLNNSKRTGTAVKYPLPPFHKWLRARRISLSRLTPEHVSHFLSDYSKRPAKRDAKSSARRRLLRYLSWLHDEGHIPFDPVCLKPAYQRNTLLDDDAHRFLRYLRTTRKPGTVSGYRSTLIIFRQWLESNHLAMNDITRTHMTQWFAELADAGQSASSRAGKVVHIRIYFSWLNEERILSTNAIHLVRTADIPKLPKYLPRPLSSAVDEQLQKRLASENSVFHQGLLLMRKTGIRIGELRALPKNCIHGDYAGNHFLKVPLGKLDNERLVPLDDDTLALVMKLQKTNSGPLKKWLIEDHRNRKTAYHHYRAALAEASKGLDTDKKITSHRLRHTYATALLNGGMSLVSVMKILGHRSYRMTLRYAAVTQETVGREYRQALEQLENKYLAALPRPPSQSKPVNPTKMLSDVSRWLKANVPDDPNAKREVALLIKRINTLKLEISRLTLILK